MCKEQPKPRITTHTVDPVNALQETQTFEHQMSRGALMFQSTLACNSLGMSQCGMSYVLAQAAGK